MEIRKATPGDLESIAEVFRKCWTISYIDILPKQVREEMSVENAREMWKAAVAPNPDRETFVIVEDGNVVGMARVGADEENTSRGHLFSLYISPESAGKGFGRALLRVVLNSLKERGFTRFSLWVFKDNPTARALYESEGFVITGAEKIDPRWKIPQIEMATVK